MRSLYESIIQSRFPDHKIEESVLTKSGVGKIYRIREWLKYHLSLSSFNWEPTTNIDQHVSFNQDDTINIIGFRPWIFLDTNEKIPDHIRFKEAGTFALAWNGIMDDWSFLPDKMQRLFLTNHRMFGATTVKNLKLDLDKVQLNPTDIFELNSTKIDIQDIEIKMGKNKKIKLNVPGRKFVNIKCDATDILLDSISSDEVARMVITDPVSGYIKNMDHFFPKKNYPNLTYIALGTKDKDLVFDKDAKKWKWV